MTDDPLLLTIPEAAALLRVGRNTCYQLARERRIPTIRLGRRLLIPRAALLRWLEEYALTSETLTAVVPLPATTGRR